MSYRDVFYTKNSVYERKIQMKKLIQLTLSLMLLTIIIPSHLALAKSDVDSIQKKGKLVLGTSADFPPFEWVVLKEGKEEIIGVDIELAQKIADELDVELEVRNMGFDTLIQSVKAGRIDIALAGLNQTEERAKQIDFSTPYYQGESYILIPKEHENKIKSLEDLKGLKVGAQKATIQEGYLVDSDIEMNIISMQKNDVLIEALKTGQLDAVLMDGVTAGEFLRKDSEVITKANQAISNSGAGQSAVVAKGNETLLEVVNKVIEQSKEKDEINQAIEKYLDLAAQQQ